MKNGQSGETTISFSKNTQTKPPKEMHKQTHQHRMHLQDSPLVPTALRQPQATSLLQTQLNRLVEIDGWTRKMREREERSIIALMKNAETGKSNGGQTAVLFVIVYCDILRIVIL